MTRFSCVTTGILIGLLAGTLFAGDRPPGERAHTVRESAFERLYIEGQDAVPVLKEASGSQDPETRRRAKRLLFLIRWKISPALFLRIGILWDDFERLPPRGRIQRILQLEGLKEEGAVQLLQRTVEIDPHPNVRNQARRSLAKLALVRLNREGCRLMEKGKFAEAEAKFNEILELDPGNNIALYNLACSRSLQGDIDAAFDYLKAAIRNGFRNFEWAREDPDLENLRKDPRFESLLASSGKD
ncbi:MAG: TPR end-of-group domain-containing protein [Planctomycetota bacterium]|jgi:tetratricopeptide (TPR) repeat protein